MNSLARTVLVAPLVVASACERAGPRQPVERLLEVTGMEYAFRGPDSVDAGRTVVRLKNEGKVLHEMIVMKLRPGTTLKALVDSQAARVSVRPLIEGGNSVLFAPPQTTGSGELVVDFEPGRDYVLWCNFTDGEGKPPHATLGMFKLVHVRATESPPPVTARQVVNIETVDYAFRLPDTVSAGETELRLHNAGQQRHEVSFGRLAPGVTAKHFMTEFLAKRNVDALYDSTDHGAVLTAYPGDTNPVAIRTRLESGRTYLVLCEFQDAPDAPLHTSLGMFKEIVVR